MRDLNQQMTFDFSKEGVGVGKIESPGGSLFHQVYIKDNYIQNYRIITPGNWNLCPPDKFGKQGVVEVELNQRLKKESPSASDAERIIQSYYTQPFEALA